MKDVIRITIEQRDGSNDYLRDWYSKRRLEFEVDDDLHASRMIDELVKAVELFAPMITSSTRRPCS